VPKQELNLDPGPQVYPLIVAFAPHSVCSVRNPVTPGVKVNVMTSLAGPPTMYVGASVPPLAPVLLTPTKYPQPGGGFSEKFVEQ
jgi:hypothetical protein